MGDGGVACVPLQPIMDKFPASETSSSNGKLEAKPVKRTATKRMKLKRDAFFKDEQKQLKEDLETEKVKNSGKEVENVSDQNLPQKDEVEEGELGTLKSPRREVENGELTPENGEISASNKLRNDEVDNDHVSWHKSAQPERLGFNSGRLLHRGQTPEKYKKGGEYDNAEFNLWSGFTKDEAERGEFFPDRWHKEEELGKNEYGYSKGFKPDSNRERERRYERDWTPPSGKYPDEDVSPGRDFNRRGNRQHSKKVARWGVNNQEKNYQKLSSKVDDDVPSYKNEQKYGRSQGREQHSSNNLLKRHGTHIEDSIDRKDYDVHGSSKSRKLSGCNYRGTGQSGNDKLFRKPNSTRSFPDRHSFRQYDSTSSRETYDRHRRSPSYSERSPRDRERARYNEHRDWTPSRPERSPCYRGNRRDNKNQSPSYAERSPQDRPRQHDRRERSPSYLERSPRERGRLSCHRKTGRRNEDSSDNKQSDRLVEEKPAQRNTSSKDPVVLLKDPPSKNNNQNGSIEKSIFHEIYPEDQVQTPSGDGKERPLVVNGVNEELLSMEEDMDICDTPPHVPSMSNVNPGKWYYLDHLGEEHGPSRLCELKVLMDEGKMMSDHLVKHSDSDRWVSVENAASPLARTNFTPVFSDSVTQLASPPEAPGNALVEVGDAEQSGNQIVVESPNAFAQAGIRVDDSLSLKDFSIDLRVGALLDGFTVIPGKELEIVGEALQMSFDQSEWERFGSMEGITQDHPSCEELSEQNQEVDILRHPDTAESTSSGSFDKECGYMFSDFTEWFSSRWSCKGGDWQRNDEVVQEKSFRKKMVLNDGYPICQMSKSGYEDPRWQRKEDLYFPCQGRKLDIPSWALSWSDENCDANVKSAQSKSAVVRGVKGTVMPVVRINACVVKDSGPFASESRSKHRENDKYSSRGSKHHSSSSDTTKLVGEDTFHPKSFNELCTMESWKPSVFNKPKDRLCTVGDLQLHLGDWYYLDGTGHEHGPYSCKVLQALVQEGSLKKESSVFRKIDEVWVPVTSVIKASKDNAKFSEASTAPSSGTSEAYVALSARNSLVSSLFHSLHPQFIGYTHGKLHELVMKSYKSREFAAAINEVLDPWINSRQPKKEIEKHLFNKTTNRSYLSLQKSSIENRVSSFYEDDTYSRKKRRTTIDGVEEEYEIGEDLPLLFFNEPSFEDLCGHSAFCKEKDECYENEVGSWGLLDGNVLARIFHFLRTDVKSLVFSALTCKHWRAAVGFYKNLSVRVDLSTLGSNCTDSAIGSFLNGYDKQMIKALVLDGCTNISSDVLLEILQSFPCISCVDIRGCNQFEDLILKFPHVNWVMGHSPQDMRIVDDSKLKIRSSKHMTEQTSSVSKLGHARYMEESSGLKDYFDMVDRRGAENQAFRQSLYKRTKVVDARRSASSLARDARMRHWAIKEAGSGYRKMEKFLVISLKDIMKGKTSDYFSPKVADIENRIKSGYYARHGLDSAKQDINKMCREAVTMKSRGSEGDMENMITLFIKLSTSLDGKTAADKDEIMKLRDEASGSYGYKKYNRSVTERKYTARASSSFPNGGGSDYMEYSSDRELRRNLSKVSKKLSSESGSSDEFELSSEDDESDTESVSDTQSDSDMRSEGGALESKDGYVAVDETFDMIPDDREWGARMTKASLVPPVTRKYEVIDHYVIVADEVEVRHKMRVSLPDHYEDKMKAHKNGSEEIDMDIPEVKEYKPRKQVGEEVIEQEVYGIDPYTYNLLLDSMPEDLDWSPTEKHIFVEDVLLRVLNKQARQFTGSRSTPMIYPLKPVVEELLATSKERHDTRTAKMCEALLNAINTRHEDKYMAYRKGLGVVCNKQDGFIADDFVVEFLGEVYPAWKWFEKQDGIRSLQKNSKDTAPEFYNIYLERPKGDADGYDLVVVDAMHKANYASRICHSCKPNCEAKVTAVGGQYQIGIYSTRPIGFGEEVTFDYNSVTESKEEYEASVCLCGSTVCRGSYLNLTGQGAFQKVLKECHGLLDKHRLLLEACQLNWVSEEDFIELGKAGLGNCLLGGLPDWLVAYSAKLVRFINFERTKLPEEILKHNLDEKRKYYTEISIEMEKSDAEIQAEGVFNQRLQNLALTLDKVRYVLRCVFGDPKKAPPPLQKLTPEEMVSVVWNGEGSLVSDLLECVAPHIDDRMLQDLKSKIRAHDPSTSGNMEKELRKSLLWLRDEVRGLPCTYKSRHDAAADIIHLYAYTKSLFKIREYKTVTSPPVYISPLDLGPKCADKLSGVTEYCKIYGENYCLGQLIYWHNQANADPDRVLARASRGCLSLPDLCSFYAKAQTPSRQRVYGPRTVRFMLARMVKQRQRLWPKNRIWCFKSSSKVFGSPMLDSVLRNCPLEREMVVWLKNRLAIFQGMWDR